uniref:Uncharacterized protein n=1 Tax=Mimiviridae sp. ChoanoV1 TaxID=2596887 RepID=A0A5B8IHV2_9VIRU|nr:hypothetical protein 1_257 [Mimiviridae sp. ChoanoV1]
MSEIFNKVDILDGGLKIGKNKRNMNGCLRFENDKLEIYNYVKDCEGNNWSNLMPRIASRNNLGLIKLGNNLIIDENTGEVSSISSAKSQIYQHIIHISPKRNNNNILLPKKIKDNVSKSDFYSINEAINFINSLKDFNRDYENQWIIQLCPGIYEENNIVIPKFVSLYGYGMENTIIKIENIIIDSNTTIKDLSIKIKSQNENTILINSESDGYNKLLNLNISDMLFENRYLINNKNSNLLIENTKIKIQCHDNKSVNIINVNEGSNLEIINSDINIYSSNLELDVINAKYSNIKIKNSEILVNFDLDISLKTNSKFRCFNLLYTNLFLFNTIIENNLFEGVIINTNEDEAYNIEMISKLEKKKNIISFNADNLMLNDIKGVCINQKKFIIKNLEIDVNNNIRIIIDSLENSILKDGIYEDVILEYLYEIKIFNSFLNSEPKLEKHYFLNKIN